MNINELSTVEDSNRPNVSVIPLFKDDREEVRVEQWQANTKVEIDVPSGAELLVLEGSFFEGEDEFTTQSWLRVPTHSKVIAKAGVEGAKVWLKTGHLAAI